MGDPICKFESDKVRMSAMIWMTAPQMGSCMANGIFVVGVASLSVEPTMAAAVAVLPGKRLSMPGSRLWPPESGQVHLFIW